MTDTGTITETGSIQTKSATPSHIQSPESVEKLLNKPASPSEDTYAIDIIETASLQEEISKHPDWSKLDKKQKFARAFLLTLKILIVLALLYFFICSIQVLSRGFQIIGGPDPQILFQRKALRNPVVGLMCGVLFTVVVQSSSVATSAIVGLVAGKIITVQIAIPIVMGSNVGTSLTNTIFAMLQLGNRDRFRRAFAAATVHDMFNWLTTVVLLPLECATGYLQYTSEFLVRELEFYESEKHKNQTITLLNGLTDPLVDQIIRLNKTVSNNWNHWNITIKKWAKKKSAVATSGHLFAKTGLSDKLVGTVVLIVAFVFLLICLLAMVHTLKSILKGKMAIWIRGISQSNLPHCPSMTEYLLVLMGAIFTFLVQSSSAFTSILPPLVSIKALSIERAYCLTLGANVGTTTTAFIVALTQSENFKEGLRIAICHLLFNLTGVLLFFPIECMRFPIPMAKFLGNTTARYRWFAIVYVLFLFIILPLAFMGLAFAGTPYIITMTCIMLVVFLTVVTINSLREYKRFLPNFLLSWKWLPLGLRSLEPYDKCFAKLACCKRLIRSGKSTTSMKDSKSVKTDGSGEPAAGDKNTQTSKTSHDTSSLATEDSSKGPIKY